jgi:hypothetical protein
MSNGELNSPQEGQEIVPRVTHGPGRRADLDSHQQVEVVQYDPGRFSCTEEPAHQTYEQRGTVVASEVHVGHQIHAHDSNELDTLRSVISDLEPGELGMGAF